MLHTAVEVPLTYKSPIAIADLEILEDEVNTSEEVDFFQDLLGKFHGKLNDEELHNYSTVLLNDFNEALSTMHLLRDLYPNYYSPILNMAKLYIQKNKLLEAKVLIQDTKFDTDNKRILNILQKLLYYVEDRIEGSLDE